MRRCSAWLPLVLGTCLALSFPAVFANPVPADAQSLLNGSDLYTRHCADCHGWAPMQRYNERFDDDGISEEFDFSDLVAEEYGSLEEEEDNTVYVEDEFEWPEWAEFPDPGDKADDPDERRLLMEEMTRAIDDYYGTGEQEEEIAEIVDEDPEFTLSDPMADITYLDDRQAGATDLLQPNLFLYGSSEFDLFRSIAEGNGLLMPGFREELESEEAIWDLVNFLRSLWPKEDAYAY